MILKLILISGLLVLSSAATAKCFEVAYKLAIKNVAVAASPQICGKELNRLTVKVKEGARNNNPKFSGVSLYVKDDEGRIVTRQNLQSLRDKNSDSLYSCINADYVRNSSIKIHLYKVKEETTSNKNSTKRSVSSTSIIGECNLSDIVDHT